MGASYSGLYVEGEVEHIHVLPTPTLICYMYMFQDRVLNSDTNTPPEGAVIIKIAIAHYQKAEGSRWKKSFI